MNMLQLFTILRVKFWRSKLLEIGGEEGKQKIAFLSGFPYHNLGHRTCISGNPHRPVPAQVLYYCLEPPTGAVILLTQEASSEYILLLGLCLLPGSPGQRARKRM